MSGSVRRRSGLIAAIAFLVVCLIAGGAASAKTIYIYVDQNAIPDSNSATIGTSWEHAYTSLQDALSKAQTQASQANPAEVWVAAGTYSPGSNGADTFTLVSNVNLYGGFPENSYRSKPDWSARDSETNVTTLTGEDVCYHVVTVQSGSTLATVDGFAITGGNADGISGVNLCDLFGGGMLIINSDNTVTVNHCIFTRNVASVGGGGMAVLVDGSGVCDPVVENCTFSENSAGNSALFSTASGGGMINSSSSPTVINCTFTHNEAAASGSGSESTGGGMTNGGGQVTMTNCTFTGNEASSSGSGSVSAGGGMFNAAGRVTMTYCTFTDNKATAFGSSSTAEGGGLFTTTLDVSTPTLGPVALGATIVAGNTVSEGGSGSDVYNGETVMGGGTVYGGAVISEGYNLIGDTSGVTITYGQNKGTDLTGIKLNQLGLGPLADNRGPVETCALLPDSPAINAVPTDTFKDAFSQTTLWPDGPTDARGVIRPQGSACDIGAFEYQGLQVGDVNGDGAINILDVRLCQQIADGVIQGTTGERQRADMNGDGRVTLSDVQLLAQYVAGIGATQ